MRHRLSAVFVLLIFALVASYSFAKVHPVQHDKTGKYNNVKWMSPIDMEKDDAGRISWKLEVGEIIDDSNMIASCVSYGKMDVFRNNEAEFVYQGHPIRDSNGKVIGPIKVWVKGYPTNQINKSNGRATLRNLDARVVEMKEVKNSDGSTITIPLVEVVFKPKEKQKPKNFDGPNKAN